MKKLKAVELSNNVTTIGQGAFETCGSLTTIYITGNEPVAGTADLSNITKFTGGYIFDGTPNIENYILSDSLTSTIQTETFKTSANGGKMTSLTVPASVPGIGAIVFSGNKNFKTLTILGMDTTISEYAFSNKTDPSASGYTNLIGNVTIVAYEGSEAQKYAKTNMMMFKDIETGEEIDYSVVTSGEVVLSGTMGDNINYSVVQIEDTDTYELAFTGTGAAIVTGVSSASELPYAEYADKIVKATVRGGKSIGDYAFADMANLESVELSGNVKTLGNSVFANCVSLRSIYIANTEIVEGKADLAAVTAFGKACFMGTALSTVELSASVTSIPEKAFKESALTTLTIPAKVTEIGAEAFMGCADLSSVTLNGQKYTIGTNAFTGLANGAVITAYEATPAEEIANTNGYTFNSLGEIPHTIEGEIVSQYVNVAWVFDELTKVLTVTTTKTGWNESGGVNLNGSWAKIVDQIEEVVLIGNMSKISGYAFSGAVNLKKVTMPSNVAQINGSAFDGCTNLTTIQVAGMADMPGVVNLGTMAGDGNGKNSLSDSSNVFRNATSVTAMALGSIYSEENPLNASNIPPNLKTIYGSTEYLENYCAENGLEFVPYGTASTSNAYWTIDTDTQTLTLHGTGTVNGLSSAVNAYAADVKYVVIERGITELGDGALADLTKLESVTFNGDAPTVAADAKPFGERDTAFTVIVKSGAEGFEGDTWCGYTLVKMTYVAGDINDDGEINTMDAVLLAQYLAGWSVTINENAADTNGDGEITTMDAVLLAQYLAKWNVTLVGGSQPYPDPDPDPYPDPEPGTDSEDNEIEEGDFMGQ